MDMVERLRGFEQSDELGNGDFSACIAAADELARLRDENAKLRTCLEIVPGTEIDGIDCRDETIRLQDNQIAHLREMIEAEREAIIAKLLALGALEDGDYIAAIRARKG